MRFTKISAAACAVALTTSTLVLGAGTANAQLGAEPLQLDADVLQVDPDNGLPSIVLDHPARLDATRNSLGDIAVSIDNPSKDTILQCYGAVVSDEAARLVDAALPDATAGNEDTPAVEAAQDALDNSPIKGEFTIGQGGFVFPGQSSNAQVSISEDDEHTKPGAYAMCYVITLPERVKSMEDIDSVTEEEAAAAQETTQVVIETTAHSGGGFLSSIDFGGSLGSLEDALGS